MAKRRAGSERVTRLERGIIVRVPLIPGRVALTPWIGTTTEYPVRVDGDRLCTAGHLGPVAQERDVVALRGECLAGRLRVARLDAEGAARLVVPARLLDGPLHVEAVVDQTDGELEVRLHLSVPAGRAEDEA